MSAMHLLVSNSFLFKQTLQKATTPFPGKTHRPVSGRAVFVNYVANLHNEIQLLYGQNWDDKNDY